MDLDPLGGLLSATPRAATTSPRSSSPSTRTAPSSRYRTETSRTSAPTSGLLDRTPTYLHGPAAGGPYRTPLEYVNVKAVFTNTVPVDAYRGAGRPEGTYQLERLVDKAAREMGIDPVEIRRQELHPPRGVPLPDPARGGLRQRQLPRDARQVLEIADLRRLPGPPRGGGERGKLRGFGFSTWSNAAASPPRS